MSYAQHNGSQQRGVSEEHKGCGIRRTVIEIDLPTLAFFDTHPGTLKGKIPNKVAGQPGE
jgi:hypothetical protein